MENGDFFLPDKRGQLLFICCAPTPDKKKQPWILYSVQNVGGGVLKATHQFEPGNLSIAVHLEALRYTVQSGQDFGSIGSYLPDLQPFREVVEEFCAEGVGFV